MAKKKSEPVLLKNHSFSLGQMMDNIINGPAPKPMTPEKQAEINNLLKQLKESQGPGDSFVVLNVSPKKEKLN